MSEIQVVKKKAPEQIVIKRKQQGSILEDLKKLMIQAKPKDLVLLDIKDPRAHTINTVVHPLDKLAAPSPPEGIKLELNNNKFIVTGNNHAKITETLLNYYRCLSGSDPTLQRVQYDTQIDKNEELVNYMAKAYEQEGCVHQMMKDVPTLDNSVTFSYSILSGDPNTKINVVKWIDDSMRQPLAINIRRIMGHPYAEQVGCVKSYCTSAEGLIVENLLCAMKLLKNVEYKETPVVDFGRHVACNKIYDVLSVFNDIEPAKV